MRPQLASRAAAQMARSTVDLPGARWVSREEEEEQQRGRGGENECGSTGQSALLPPIRRLRHPALPKHSTPSPPFPPPPSPAMLGPVSSAILLSSTSLVTVVELRPSIQYGHKPCSTMRLLLSPSAPRALPPPSPPTPTLELVPAAAPAAAPCPPAASSCGSVQPRASACPTCSTSACISTLKLEAVASARR